MENILFVNACVRPESRTMQLAEYILDRLCGQVAEVNLEQEQIQPLNRERLEERDAVLAVGQDEGVHVLLVGVGVGAVNDQLIKGVGGLGPHAPQHPETVVHRKTSMVIALGVGAAWGRPALSVTATPCQDPYPFCPFGTFPLDKGNRPPGRGKALSVPLQAFKVLRRSPHPPLRGTFPQGKAKFAYTMSSPRGRRN